MIKLEIKNLDQVKRNLQMKANKIRAGDSNALQEAAQLGHQFAEASAPHYSGAMSDAIIVFAESREVWVISSRPAPSDNGFPVNIPFETGQFGNMTMWGPGRSRIPFKPRNPGTIGFMSKTAEFLEKELAERIGLNVERTLR